MKICDRHYSESSMLTVKQIKGVNCCPACEKPIDCHGKTIEQRALFWALSDDKGISSEAICNFMLNYPQGLPMPPSDAGDRGRCIRLLEIIPEWIPRLSGMVKYDQTNKGDGFIVNSSGISAYDNSWSKQIPLILQEGKL